MYRLLDPMLLSNLTAMSIDVALRGMQALAESTVVMSDDDIYIPGPLKGVIVAIFVPISAIVTTLFWQLLASWRDRAIRAEKLYDGLLPVLSDSTSTVEKLNTSVTAMMETVREERRDARRRTT